MDAIAKPDELLALHDVTEELFTTLKGWFAVPDSVSLDLTDVDAVVREMADPAMIAALAMRKLQALRLLATPGVRTSTDVVVTMIGDLDRALVQAPTMRLEREAENTDWDAAFAGLDRLDQLDADDSVAAPEAVDDTDPETERFRALHAALHDAAIAVVEASDGEIRYLE